MSRMQTISGLAPLLARTDHAEPSVFLPENLLRESRRQKGLAGGTVPEICVLDPDGDLAQHVRTARGATSSACWACYHTELWEWRQEGSEFGVIGRAVGASFAVLLAEQLFASGCRLLIGLSSAGLIAEDLGEPPYFIAIERAVRDEGTSYHYLPAAEYAECDPALLDRMLPAMRATGQAVHRGATWTTDAPYRETAQTIAERRAQGVLAVEMEAAALYAFAEARGRAVLCLAHVSNRLGCVTNDFEKGEANGAPDALQMITAIANTWINY
jgi:uridine phosphorylase